MNKLDKSKLKFGKTISTEEALKDVEPFNIREAVRSNNVAIEWTDEVVYTVYCNDNLEELPIKILKQMRSHIDSIIQNKI